MLLINDEVEIVESVFCGPRLFPNHFRQNTVEFCADDNGVSLSYPASQHRNDIPALHSGRYLNPRCNNHLGISN
jgi:hypothetical protein